MRKKVLERILGGILAIVVGVSAPISAYAAEDSFTEEQPFDEEETDIEETEIPDEIIEEKEEPEVEELSAEDNSEEGDLNTGAASDSEGSELYSGAASVLSTAQVPDKEVYPYKVDKNGYPVFDVEFNGFGPQADKALEEMKEKAYSVYTGKIGRAFSDGTYDSTDEFEIFIYFEAVPFYENGVLTTATSQEDKEFTCNVQEDYWDEEELVIHGYVSKEFVESGETLCLTANWEMCRIDNKFILDANGGVFDDSFYGGGTLTYSLGEHGLTPVEGRMNTAVQITYSEDRTQAYVPVMQNGFYPVRMDDTGITMDLAGRPFEGKLPLLYWNTRKNGKGESYTEGDIELERRSYKLSDGSNPEKCLKLYAIYPMYYGAEFILDDESFVGGCWVDPGEGRTMSLKDMYEIARTDAGEKFVKEGYTLSWYLDEDYFVPANFSAVLDTCDNMDEILKVYGKWTSIEPEVKGPCGTVTLENLEGAVAAAGNNSYNASKGISLEVGKTLDLAKYQFTKNGYTFKNWTATVDGKEKTFLKNAKLQKLFGEDGQKITLTANWTRVNYRIAYVLNGGRQTGAPTGYNTEIQTALPVPSKAGYVFAGWEIKRDGKKVTDPEALAAIYDADNNMISKGAFGNLTLSAVYVPFSYKILFHVEGIDEPLVLNGYGMEEPLLYTSSINFESAAKQIKDAMVERLGEDAVKGVQVKGFAKTQGGKITYDRTRKYTNLTQNEEELHLYAVLEKGTYYINYHLDEYEGAKLSTPLYTYHSMSRRFTLPVATRPGYKFYGWNFNEWGNRNSDKALFASWVIKNTPSEGYKEFATVVAPAANNDIDITPHFEPNKIRIFVAANGANVQEEKEYVNRDGETDWKNVPVGGRRLYGDVYYDGYLASEGYDDSMEHWFRPGYIKVGYSYNPKPKSEDEIFPTLDPGYVNRAATSGSGTVYCIWKPVSNSINACAATLMDGKEVLDESCYDYDSARYSFSLTCEDKTVTLEKPQLWGYDFLGWKLVDEDAVDRCTKITKRGGYVVSVNAGNCSDINIYPVFNRCRYDLEYNLQGGSYKNKRNGVLKKNVDFSEDVSSLVADFNAGNVIRKGYTLQGFSRDPKGETGLVLNAEGKPLYRSKKLVLNGRKKVTLYAIWTKN